MKIKNIYLVLCLLGLVVPCASFIPWVIENGFNFPLLANQIASSPVSLFGWLDVIISAVTLFFFIYNDAPKRKVRFWWLSIAGTLTVGVSFGLPLYLYLREISKTE